MKSLKITLFALVVALLATTVSLHAQPPAGNYPNKTDSLGRKQGAWKKLDDKGTVVYVGQFKDDMPVGMFTYYDTEGRIMVEMSFLAKGVAYGKMYYVNAKVQAEGKYVNQQKDSIWRFYNTDGLLLSEEMYAKGLRNGKSVTYYPGTTHVDESKTYKNDTLVGVWTQFFDDGSKKAEGNYVRGKYDGRAVWYYHDGQINIVGVYKSDLKDGKWVYYNNDGTVKTTDVYKNGKLTSGDHVISVDDFNKSLPDGTQQNPGSTDGQDPGGGQ